MPRKRVNHRDRSITFYEDRGFIVASVESKRMRVRNLPEPSDLTLLAKALPLLRHADNCRRAFGPECSCVKEKLAEEIQRRIEGPDDMKSAMLVWFYGTVDLLGFADLACWDREGRSVLVQYTSGANHAARRAKIMENGTAQVLMDRGVGVHVLSWDKPAGKHRYEPRLEVLSGPAVEQEPTQEALL